MKRYMHEKVYKKLMEEYEEMIGPKKREISAALHEAAKHGDFRENAEYDAALFDRNLLAARVKQIQDAMNNIEIIKEINQDPSRVTIYTEVTVLDLDTDEESVYKIVDDFSVKDNYISYQAPLGRALLGKEEGDLVEVKLPNGNERDLEIMKINPVQIEELL